MVSQRQLVVLIITIAVAVMVFVLSILYPPTRQKTLSSSTPTNSQSAVVEPTNANRTPTAPANTAQRVVALPISGFFDRVMKKPFGIFITPATSPIQPERFTGYHTGADAEATAQEANTDVPVYAVAAGTVIFTGHVNGYGGFLAIRITIDQQTVIATYGHVRLSSVTVKVGDSIAFGEQIAVLGTGYSTETDGERKHLHFGIINSSTLDFRGYVQKQSELSGWKDPVLWLQQHQAASSMWTDTKPHG